MRFLIKLVFIFIILFGLGYYYNIYTFQNGLADFRGRDGKIDDNEIVEYYSEDLELSYLKLPFSDDSYFMFYYGDGKTIILIENNKDTVLANELSYIPFGLGIIGIFAILLNRKPYRD